MRAEAAARVPSSDAGYSLNVVALVVVTDTTGNGIACWVIWGVAELLLQLYKAVVRAMPDNSLTRL